MNAYQVNIFTSFDQAAIIDPQQELMGQGNISTYMNTVPGTQTLLISAHNINQITNLVITSNGITDGNFNLFPIKYTNEAVNFVATLQDSSGYDIKDYPLLQLNNFTFFLADLNGNQVPDVGFVSNFGTLSTLTQGGFFKGTFTSLTSALSVVLVACLDTGSLTLTGVSNTFSIYPSGGIYQLRKVNENFNQTAAYLDLATQPILYGQTTFFNNLLGQIVGNNNSNPNTLGIETFEKIANYVSNINDIDYSNLNQLKSLLNNINSTYQDFNYDYPPSLRRLTDMLSIKHSKLFGQTNQWQGNFNTKNFVSNSKYGANLGQQLDFNSTVLSAGSAIQPNYIVTLENFSQTFNLVNTNLINLTCYQTVVDLVSTYPLSALDNTWGWGLVLPSNQNPNPGLYYNFYQYIPKTQGSLLQEFLDFNNPNNTLSITNSAYTDYTGQGGIMDNILLDSMYTGLNILSVIPYPSVTPFVSISPTPSQTPSPTQSPSLTPSASITPSLTPSASITPINTPSPTPSTTTSPIPFPSRTPPPTITPTPSTSIFPSFTPSNTPYPSITPSPSLSGAPFPSRTPFSTVTPTASPSSSFGASSTPSVSPTPVPSSTPSITPSTTPIAPGQGVRFVTYN
jgi:hypothetical protein